LPDLCLNICCPIYAAGYAPMNANMCNTFSGILEYPEDPGDEIELMYSPVFLSIQKILEMK
jgi:hypothetical protein